MDWSSELTLRSLKRRHIVEQQLNQSAKISRLSFLSEVANTKHLNHELSSGTDTNHLNHELSSRADTKHLNHETSSGNYYDITPLSDASQFMLKSDAANGFSRMYSLPVNSVVLKSANVEDQYTSHLNDRVQDPVTCPKTVLEKDVCSANINVTLMDQDSKQSSGHFCISRSYPTYQAILDSGHSLTNGRRCPECAAGKSGHIQHIGRWRLRDSL